MSKPEREIDGIAITPEMIEENRRMLIAVRDGAIEHGALDWAFPLSICVGLLQHYKQEIEAETPQTCPHGTPLTEECLTCVAEDDEE